MSDKVKAEKTKGGKSGEAKGQQKLITLFNATTGATQEVSKADFKANRATYEAAGFARQDNDDDVDVVV